MKGIREVYTTEQLYEELRSRLTLSDSWLGEQHPELLQAAEAMVEALQKKESYGGGVAQRAAHLASHLKSTDPILAEYMAKRAEAEAVSAAGAAAGAPAATAMEAGDGGNTALGKGTGAAGWAGESAALPQLNTAAVPGAADGPSLAQPNCLQQQQYSVARHASEGEVAAPAADAVRAPDISGAVPVPGTGAVCALGDSSNAAAAGESGKGVNKSGGEKGSPKGTEKGGEKGPSKGGAATALEYLTTTFAHLREQRTLVMGDRKDRLLKEVAGLRQLRAGPINVLRGAKSTTTTMGEMLSALKEADTDYVGRVRGPANGGSGGGCCGGGGNATADASEASVAPAPMEVDGDAAAAPAAAAAAGSCTDGVGGGNAVDCNKKELAGPGGSKGALDNLTCIVWEDWRVPERLSALLRAGDSVCVHVEVHCRDGPEDTRLAMRLTTFVTLALCSQRLIAELYHDMFITPQRAAAARPQRKRQRTAAEETVQTLDESTDSLDFVDFVEALHRRMPLRCGWMYANAIMPTALEWDQVFGRQAGRLSGLFEGGAELDALGRACLAFHQTRHESPVLDVHALSTQLRQQKQKHLQRQKEQQQQKQQEGVQPQQQEGEQREAGEPSEGNEITTPPEYRRPRNAVELAATSASSSPAAVPVPYKPDGSCKPAHPRGGGVAAHVASTCTTADGCCAHDKVRSNAGCSAAAPTPSLILRSPGDSSGCGQQGLDLGHLSCCCVTAAPLADDFLGELIRQTTAGQAAAEVAAAAAAAAAAKAKKCAAAAAASGSECPGTCAEEAAAAVAAANAAAAAVAMFFGGGAAFDEEEEAELYDAVKEELMAVEEAAEEAQHEVEVQIVREVKALVAAASANGGSGPAGRSSGSLHHLKGAFSHRMQLLPGVFFSYYIGSQAFTNTAWHVEDFLLQSINLMLVGRPKAWWWVPRDKEQVFKDHLEDQWDTEDIYTKSVPLAAIPLEKLIKMGVRRSVQLPGMIFITSPGYAFHTTMSSGWSMADSANFMANVVGKDMHVLEDERPLEQYPDTEGLTSTGEWVRFTLRRIEELRAANNHTYTPKQLTRRYAEAAARKAAAAARATRVIKEEDDEDPLRVAPGAARKPATAAAAAKPPKALRMKTEVKMEGGSAPKAAPGKLHAKQNQQQQAQQQATQQPANKQPQRQQPARAQESGKKPEHARPPSSSRRRTANLRTAAPQPLAPILNDAEDAYITGRTPQAAAAAAAAATVRIIAVKEEPGAAVVVKEEPDVLVDTVPASIVGMDIDLQAACAMQEELLRSLEQPQLPQTRSHDVTDEDVRQAELALQVALMQQQRQAALQQQAMQQLHYYHPPPQLLQQPHQHPHQLSRLKESRTQPHPTPMAIALQPLYTHPQQQLQNQFVNPGTERVRTGAPESGAAQDGADGGPSGAVQMDLSWRVAVA